MNGVLASSAVDPRFDFRLGQTKDYKIDICCFSAEQTALRRKSKDWLAQNQDNVSEWGNMSTRTLLFHRVSTIKVQLSVLVLYKDIVNIISLNVTCSRRDIAENCSFAIKHQSITLHL